MIVRGLYDNNLYPATFGGAERIYRLYRHLARRAQVTVLSLLKSREPGRRSEVVDGIRIERRKAWYPTLVHYAERLGLAPMHATFGLHRSFGTAFAAHFRDRAAVYQFDSFLLTAWYGQVPEGSLKVYHAVNVETDWHAPALRRLRNPRKWEGRLRLIEEHAVRGADLVLYVSRGDGERLVRDFGARPERMLYVPNGVEPDRYRPRDEAVRARVRAELGFQPGDRVAVFTGSSMSHNLDAATAILDEIAPAAAGRPRLKFLLVGDLAERGAPRPNVRCTGRVADVVPYLWAADVALNPVVSGSGSSLKVPESLAAGLPLLSTAFGMRGFEDLVDAVTLREPGEMAGALEGIGPPPAGLAARLAAYAWEAQADRMFRAYEAWWQSPLEAPRAWASIA